MLKRVSNLTIYICFMIVLILPSTSDSTLSCYFSLHVIINLSSFTEEDGTNINNEDRKEFQMRKNAKVYSIF